MKQQTRSNLRWLGGFFGMIGLCGLVMFAGPEVRVHPFALFWASVALIGGVLMEVADRPQKAKPRKPAVYQPLQKNWVP